MCSGCHMVCMNNVKQITLLWSKVAGPCLFLLASQLHIRPTFRSGFLSQVKPGVGQMPAGAYLQQPQPGQVKAGNVPQLTQAQRGAFVPQAGQMHSGAFLHQPSPVQMQVAQ